MYSLFQNWRVRAQLQSHQSKTKPTSVKHSELDIWALFVVLWAPGVLDIFASLPLPSPAHGACLVGSGCLHPTPAAVCGCPMVPGSLICWGLLLQPRWHLQPMVSPGLSQCQAVCHDPLMSSKPVPPEKFLHMTKVSCQHKVPPWSLVQMSVTGFIVLW